MRLTFVDTGHVQPFVGAEGATGDVLVESSLAFWDFLEGDDGGLERMRDTASDPTVATLQEDAGAA